MKKNIAIIMGGYSSEYKISLKSGNVVFETLDKSKYNAYRIHIFKDKWVYVNDEGEEFPIDKNDFSINAGAFKVTFDCVFNAIHGSPGEDGFMQGYFKLINMPHTSCGMYQAALTFNKRDCLSTLKPYGIKTAESFYINLDDTINEDDIIAKVGLPCFVKANKAGSSFGITKVHKKEDLKNAIDVAFKEDDEIIIESFLDGVEVSVGVISYKGKTKVLPITEIVTDNDFFDYEAKYLGKSKEITPARLTAAQEEKVNTVAKKVYEILKMKGFSRSEYIFKNGKPHLLEVNTIPGMTSHSLVPMAAREAGMDVPALVESILTLSWEAQQ